MGNQEETVTNIRKRNREHKDDIKLCDQGGIPQ